MVNGLTRTATEMDEELLESGGIMGVCFDRRSVGRERNERTKSNQVEFPPKMTVQIHVF